MSEITQEVKDVVVEAVQKVGTEVAKAETVTIQAAQEVKSEAVVAATAVKNELVKLTETQIAVKAIEDARLVLAAAQAKAVQVRTGLENEIKTKVDEAKKEIDTLYKATESEVVKEAKEVETEASTIIVEGEKEVSAHPVLSTLIVLLIGLIVGSVTTYLIK